MRYGCHRQQHRPDSARYIVHADGATSYAFNNYAVDNSYTGNCNYTFLVRDSTMKYVVKLGPVSIPCPRAHL